MLCVALTVGLLYSGQTAAPRTGLFTTFCYAGANAAQKVLPKVPQRDELLGRAFADCDAFLKETSRTGELDDESDIAGFACGFGVGATFAKFGLVEEMDPMSERAKSAALACQSSLRRALASKREAPERPKALVAGTRPTRPVSTKPSTKRKSAFWNLSFDGLPQRCQELAVPSRSLKEVFDLRRQTDCTFSDEGDHLLFACGEVGEVVTFSKEMCSSWLKVQLTEQETRRLVGMGGCLKKAREKADVDFAVPYCNCVSDQMSVNSEAALSKMPRAQFEALVKNLAEKCAAELTND